MSSPIEKDLDSFIRTFRSQRAQSKMTSSSRDTTPYPPTPNVDIQKPINIDTIRPLPSLSNRDIQKMKYKIDLDKQVAEKQQRSTREWEMKLERDKKYVKQQAFLGRQDPTPAIKKQDLEQILIQSHVPSPLILKKPEQLSRHYQQSSIPIENKNSGTSQQPTYHDYSQSTNYSKRQTKPLSPENNFSQSSHLDFHGPNIYDNGSSIQVSSSTAHPVKDDVHDPFISFDPNKEPQQVFNIIPQQNLYEPWGRPGGGAPLIHKETGQKFTRYAGSLEQKLNTAGPLKFYRRQYNGNIDDQKRDMEIERRRRQEERMEQRLNPGATADWISQIEGSHYPLKFHLPTTRTTRHYSGTPDPHSSEETLSMRNDLARQAEERARLQQIARYEDSIADLHHTEVQNSWWDKGTSKPRNHRYDPQNTSNKPRAKWIKNHLGQVMMADDKPSTSVKYYDANYSYPKRNLHSNHTNYYQISDSKNP